ncbi:MAG: sulfide/dihydroorotate dehydrogenase-like FAD/NAD-binding protein [Verrucomicrobiae bacterium]|nr:sulfide/dihydroorotate dehydrogenase-like FAD/NAD-binding protein [Verrucomicrobiae bacterium]
MHRILFKETLAPKVTRYRIHAPQIARRRKPGQFVLVRLIKEGERFPLTLVDSDPEEGSITLIVQEVGVSSGLMARMPVGAAIQDVLGPLGRPTEIRAYGACVCVGGGIGVAPIYPIAKGLAAAGNRVAGILGARTREMLILEKEMGQVCETVQAATDDGSAGRKGLVSDALRDQLKRGATYNFAVAIGPVPMMKAVCEVTKAAGIPTIVSLNPIMVDGTGMCGGCRVVVADETRFACVDGPEFDGHQVDFDGLASRLRGYSPFRECALQGLEPESVAVAK